MEPEFYQMAPRGVSVHTARMTQKIDTIEELLRMGDYAPKAASDLATADVDCIGFGCTSGSLLGGPNYNEKLLARIKEVTDIPAITTSMAVVSALKELEIRNVSVATPYHDDINEKEKEFLEFHGFKVLSIRGLSCNGPETADLPVKLVYKHAKGAFKSGSDALFMSCTDMPSLDVIQALEFDLGKPVVSSCTATMWMMLKQVGIGEAIDGFGKLLSRPRLSGSMYEQYVVHS
jgi:maleate isomerase